MVAIIHAYKFTHFTTEKVEKTKDAKKLTGIEKIKTIFLGVNNPRPANRNIPTVDFQTIKLKSNKEIECWSIKAEKSIGTVIIFHGFSGEKSSMLDKAEIFRKLGYSIFLVDFMGSGGSEGNQTTIGYLEAEQVKSCYDYLKGQGEKNLYLFGTSMGAVAIMKAIDDYKMDLSGIIIECPFGTMYQTVCARFKTMNAPTFPMAGLLVFWGGVENGFWAFGHNPVDYAKSISCPTLLMHGALDDKVSQGEIDSIYKNIKGIKQLKIYPNVGHENYLVKYGTEWEKDVELFLNSK